MFLVFKEDSKQISLDSFVLTSKFSIFVLLVLYYPSFFYLSRILREIVAPSFIGGEALFRRTVHSNATPSVISEKFNDIWKMCQFKLA